MYTDLKGKTALVTGAGKETGIGYAIGRKLAASGMNIILADLGREGAGNGPVKTGTREELEALVKKRRRNMGWGPWGWKWM